MKWAPDYEAKGDLVNEIAVIEQVLPKTGCDSHQKTPLRYPVDFALLKGKQIEFFAEVKCRKNPISKYPEFMLSLGKYNGLVNSQIDNGIPSLLIVGWTDCIGILRLPVAGVRRGVGGRTDRGDPQDMEPVVFIPVERFSRVKKLEAQP